VRASRALAWLAVAVMGVAALVGTVHVVTDRDERADRNSAFDWADREIAWGNGWMLSQDALYAARSLIPPGAEYTVEKGPESAFQDPLTYRFAEGYWRYWLMPRHQVGGARWVVCMRCERDDLPGARVLWEDTDAGVAVIDREGAG
jgi:hypothetical protein